MFVYPVDFGDPGLMHAAAIIASALFTIWAGALFIAWRGSRRALISAFVINLLVLLAVPLSWLFFYCPADCRAQAGALFNLANTLNLVFGVLAVIGLGLQMLPSSRLTARVSPSELKND
jgi:hypothetical protein